MHYTLLIPITQSQALVPGICLIRMCREQPNVLRKLRIHQAAPTTQQRDEALDELTN